MTDHNDKNQTLLSRRKLIQHGFAMSLGLGILPHLSAEFVEALPLSQLATKEIASLPKENKPITVTIHFTAKPHQAEALVNHITQALPKVRKAAGCRYAQLYVIADHPNQVVLFKGWDSRKTQSQYLQSEQRSGRLGKLLTFVEVDPIVEYWEFQSH